jgi:hypothetical protein
MLDAAAPWAGELPERADITYFVTHPCHPSIFRYEPTREAQKDYFGGVAAPQAIVCALMQGPDEHYALCEDIAKIIYQPVSRSHRVTVEGLAILEPGLSETIGATLVTALREATDRAVEKGVPKEAAMDFMLGHLGIELGILFEDFPGQFSDGAIYAINQAKPKLLKDDWLKVLEPDEIKQSVKEICNPPQVRTANESAHIGDLLDRKGLKLGHYVGEFTTPGIGYILKEAGCDFAFLDMEHSGNSFETLHRTCATSRLPACRRWSASRPIPTTTSPARSMRGRCDRHPRWWARRTRPGPSSRR